MDSGLPRPFPSALNRDDFSALARVSRGVLPEPNLTHRLVELGFITRAFGGFILTANGSLMLANGPVI